jgi:hypothetical protein
MSLLPSDHKSELRTGVWVLRSHCKRAKLRVEEMPTVADMPTLEEMHAAAYRCLPLPTVEEMHAAMGGCQFSKLWSKMDFVSGFKPYDKTRTPWGVVSPHLWHKFLYYLQWALSDRIDHKALGWLYMQNSPVPSWGSGLCSCRSSFFKCSTFRPHQCGGWLDVASY